MHSILGIIIVMAALTAAAAATPLDVGRQSVTGCRFEACTRNWS